MNKEGLAILFSISGTTRILISPSSNQPSFDHSRREANQQLISLETLRATRIIEECVA